MAKDQTKEELNNENIDKDSVIIESGEKNEVLDFLDYIETSEHPSAIKIRNLRQHISDEQLLTLYSNNIGSGITKEELESSLEGFFVTLATHITELPNGVVIDLKTGLVDVDKSFEQALKVGIYSRESVIINSRKDSIEKLKEIDVLNLLFDKDEKFETILRGFDDSDISTNNFWADFKNFLEKETKTMNLSEDTKKLVDQLKEKMIDSPYKDDPHAYEYNMLLVMLDEAKNTTAYSGVLSLIESFHRRYPDFDVKNKTYVANPDGTINEDRKKELFEYNENYNQIIMLNHFNTFNSMTEEEFNKLDEDEKYHIRLCAFAGLAYENNDNPEFRTIAKDAKEIIGKLYQNIDFNDKKRLAGILKEDLRFKGIIDEISYEDFIGVVPLRFRAVSEDDIIKNTKEENKNRIDFSEIDFDSNARKFYKDPIKNYFVGSKIEFTDADLDIYNEDYVNCTIDSWIEDKDTAIKLRYKALQDVLKDYKEAESNPYIEGKIKELEKTIVEFEKKYAGKDLTFDDELSFDGYKDDFISAGLTKFLTRDAFNWQKGKDYKDLSDKHKRGYMRNILVCLDKIEQDEKDGLISPISKLTLRRLELMNSEGREFVSFDENGDFVINKELLLEEYLKSSSYEYKDFEELKYSAMLRKNEYLLKKLDEYTNLPEEEFLDFGDETDPNVIMGMIEERRRESNQKRIDANIDSWMKIKNDRKIIEDSPYETDMHLFELCKLHRELRDPQNVQNTQMYSIMLSKIKEFYKNHPEYEEKEIPILNEDGTLNEDEIAKMDQYSEAYQRIIIIKHLEKFEGMTQKEIEEMSKTDKQHLLLCTFAGLKYKKSNDIEVQKLSKDCMNVIKQLFPELDLENEEKIAKFFRKEMGFEGNIKQLSLDELSEIASLRVKEATEDYIEKDDSSYVGKEFDFSNLDLDSSKRKVYSSVMKNYFVGSEIEFNELDEQKYNQMYQYVTVESWIENKENAIKLRYAALNTIRDEYKNNIINPYTKEKLNKIEKSIEEFKSRYGNIDLTPKEGEVSFDVYRQQFINAGLTKYLTRDSSEWSDGRDYANLDNTQKKAYIRNALAALEYKENPDFFMTKIGLRRLELMNSKGKEFFNVNKNGEYEINEQLIVEEYNKLSKHDYLSFEELNQSVKLRKNEYVLQKLEEYTKLNAKDFVKLKDKNDYDGSMKQIERARYKSNEKRIHEMFQEEPKPESKPKPKIESKPEPKPEPKTEPKIELKTEPKVGSKAGLKMDAEEKTLDKLFEEKVQDGTIKKEDLNVTTEKTEYIEKVADQEELRVDREEAQGEQSNKEITVENINTSATKEAEINAQENIKSTLSEKVKKAVKVVKDFLEKHLSIKNKQGRLGPGEETSSNTSGNSSSGVTSKSENSNFIQTVVVDTKAAIQESQNLSQTDLQRASQAKSDDEMEIG